MRLKPVLAGQQQAGLLLTGLAQAGGNGGGWRILRADGALVPAGALPPPPPCPPLDVPESWEVRAQVYADVTGDGRPKCVLAVWRPWRDWPITRWSSSASPITANRDARGDSAHIAVLRPGPGGKYRSVWVGSALFRPVTALTVLPGGRLVTLEGRYASGSLDAGVGFAHATTSKATSSSPDGRRAGRAGTAQSRATDGGSRGVPCPNCAGGRPWATVHRGRSGDGTEIG